MVYEFPVGTSLSSFTPRDGKSGKLPLKLFVYSVYVPDGSLVFDTASRQSPVLSSVSNVTQETNHRPLAESKKIRGSETTSVSVVKRPTPKKLPRSTSWTTEAVWRL